jgi:hypothetical protein
MQQMERDKGDCPGGRARLGRYGTYLPVGRLFSNHHHNGCERL